MAVENEDIQGAREVAVAAVIDGHPGLAVATESTAPACKRRSRPRVEPVIE